MSLKIITGTLFDISDPTGKLLELYENGAFLKQRWDGQEWKVFNSGIISFSQHGDKINVVQETGAGKTILLAVLTYIAHIKGREIRGNLSFKWTPNNEGKENKKDWMPLLRSIKDIESCNNEDIELDDLYGTITAWNCKEADLIRTAALIARKAWVNINITCQFLTNQVPPDLRRITGEYHIPFIRCFDSTNKAPDGRDTPLELIDLRLNSHLMFKGYSVYDLTSETGQEIMNGFNTLEVATALGANDEEGARTNQPGYILEAKAFEYLKENAPAMNWQHLNGKHVFDIVCDTHAIDVTGIDPDGGLILDHKDLSRHMRTARRMGQKPYLMFQRAGKWILVQITPNLSDQVEGKRIHPARIGAARMKTLEKAIGGF
jgi:hypothetical protein